jgi:hypothetical protein
MNEAVAAGRNPEAPRTGEFSATSLGGSESIETFGLPQFNGNLIKRASFFSDQSKIVRTVMESDGQLP